MSRFGDRFSDHASRVGVFVRSWGLLLLVGLAIVPSRGLRADECFDRLKRGGKALNDARDGKETTDVAFNAALTAFKDAVRPCEANLALSAKPYQALGLVYQEWAERDIQLTPGVPQNGAIDLYTNQNAWMGPLKVNGGRLNKVFDRLRLSLSNYWKYIKVHREKNNGADPRDLADVQESIGQVVKLVNPFLLLQEPVKGLRTVAVEAGRYEVRGQDQLDVSISETKTGVSILMPDVPYVFRLVDAKGEVWCEPLDPRDFENEVALLQVVNGRCSAKIKPAERIVEKDPTPKQGGNLTQSGPSWISRRSWAFWAGSVAAVTGAGLLTYAGIDFAQNNGKLSSRDPSYDQAKMRNILFPTLGGVLVAGGVAALVYEFAFASSSAPKSGMTSMPTLVVVPMGDRVNVGLHGSF